MIQRLDCEVDAVQTTLLIGLATAMMGRAEKIAKEFGCRSIGMLVKPENEGARRLYEGLGYIIGYIYEDGDLLMCKAI